MGRYAGPVGRRFHLSFWPSEGSARLTKILSSFHSSSDTPNHRCLQLLPKSGFKTVSGKANIKVLAKYQSLDDQGRPRLLILKDQSARL